MSAKMTAEQLAQHISSEWGPLETTERVKMIVVVRGMIEKFAQEAREEALKHCGKENCMGYVLDGYTNWVTVEAKNAAYASGFSAGAREMRETAAKFVIDDAGGIDYGMAEAIRALPIPATEGPSPTAKPSSAKGEK